MENKILVQQGMCIAVMGFGVTGQAAVRYCLDRGAAVKVSDTRSEDALQAEFAEYFKAHDIEWEAGGHSAAFLIDADLVIVSPGISLDDPVIGELQEAGIPLVGELAVAAPHLRVPTAAITGTNGKTTVTSLLGHILRTAGKKVFVGGNIGTPLLDYLCGEGDAEYLVLEVSSFQLQTAGSFTPDIGVVLNISPDHLDRHADLDDYAAVKMSMLCNQTPANGAVLYADDDRCVASKDTLKGQVFTFGQDESSDAVIDGTRVRLRLDGKSEIFDLAGCGLGNTIGARNSAAAILAASFWGVSGEDIREGLSTFSPLPHRMAPVGDLNGVSFVNDSKATNTGAVIAALQQIAGNVVLIAGGKDKGDDYSLLRDSIMEKARAVILIGESSEKIAGLLGECAPIIRAADMDSAVRIAYEQTRPGDTVLLSPACASFDMFSSYVHRGRVFTEAVASLIKETKQHGAVHTNG